MLSFLFTITEGACGRKSILVEKDIPPDVDAAFLTVTDTNPLDKDSYECAHLPSSTSDLV